MAQIRFIKLNAGVLTQHVESTDSIRIASLGLGVTSPSDGLAINGTTSPGVSSAGTGRIYFDSGSNLFKVSENGGAYANLVGGGGGMAIGGAITGATQGSVLFAGLAGILAQDNAGFFWDAAANTLKVNRTNSGSTGGEILIKNETPAGNGSTAALRFFTSNVGGLASSAFVDTNHSVAGDGYSSVLSLSKRRSQTATLSPYFYWDIREYSGDPSRDHGQFGVNVYPTSPLHVSGNNSNGPVSLIASTVSHPDIPIAVWSASGKERALLVLSTNGGGADYSYSAFSLYPQRGGSFNKTESLVNLYTGDPTSADQSTMWIGVHDGPGSWAGSPINTAYVWSGHNGTGADKPISIRVGGTSPASGTEAIRVNPLGPFVGMGTSTPASKLHLRDGNLLVTGTATNPYLKLLLHADGVGAAFVDSSPAARTVTANADATQSATQFKFGGKSAYFDGTGDYISVPDSTDWDFGSGDFTVDLWARPEATPAGLKIVYVQASFGDFAPLAVFFDTGDFRLYSSSTGNSWDIANNVLIGTATAGVWYHIAVVREGTNLRYFFNGVLVGTIVTGASLMVSDDPLYIGGINNVAYTFDGYIDEVRVAKGIAYYTATFTPPTVAYESGTGPGSIGIGVTNLVNRLDAAGSAAIGAAYAGVTAAPANGLIVEGSVGIGTNAPTASALLHVQKNFDGATLSIIENTSAGNSAEVDHQVKNNLGHVGQYGIYSSTHSTLGVLLTDTAYYYADTSNGMAFVAQHASGTFRWGLGASYTEAMRLTAGGNLGIGTTAPLNKIDVNGGMTVGYSTPAALPASIIFAARAAADQVFYIEDNVDLASGVALGSGNDSFSVQQPMEIRGSNIRLTGVENNTSFLDFVTTTASVREIRMRITNDGGVGIGTTTTAGAKLSVAGHVRAANGSTGSSIISNYGTRLAKVRFQQVQGGEGAIDVNVDPDSVVDDVGKSPWRLVFGQNYNDPSLNYFAVQTNTAGVAWSLATVRNAIWAYNNGNVRLNGTTTGAPADNGKTLQVDGSTGLIGNAAIGATYAATAAPTNGLIVEGNVGIGTSAPSSNKLSVVGGALASTKNALLVTGTLPNGSAGEAGVKFTIGTTAGSANFSRIALEATLGANTTPNENTIAVYGQNNTTGTGASIKDQLGNSGLFGNSLGAATTGYRYGFLGLATGGAKNIGAYGFANGAVAGDNIGTLGMGVNTGAGAAIGGLFVLGQTTDPVTTTSAALIADNGPVAAPLFLAREAATDDVFRIDRTAAGGVIVNEAGLDRDFRIESDTNANIFFVDGTGAGGVGIGTNAPSSSLHVNGSQTVKRTAVGGGDYTVLVTDYIIAKTTITAGDDIFLPAAATAAVGKVYIIKDESGTAATNNITIDGNGSETIDGVLTFAITTNYGSVSIYTDGSNWFIF